MSDNPLLDKLLGPDGPELTCDECFEHLDRYVEVEAAKGMGFELCPACVSPGECRRASSCRGMRAHLEGCPACAEEYESLKALLADSGHA